MQKYDAVVVGAGPAGSAAAKKCTDNGLKTLLVDRCKLPRRKACSGIITNLAQNYVYENFGPIPEAAFGRPYAAKGAALYFPGVGQPVFFDTDCHSPYIWRDKFDFFLAEKSGAELCDETRFLRLTEKNNKLEVILKQKNRQIKVRASYLVGADGGWSRVIHSFAPDVYDNVQFAFACQKYFEGTVDADEHYLYWFCLREISPYPWLNIKDGQIIIGLANMAGGRFTPAFGAFLNFLKANCGLKIKKELATEGCKANLMTPLNQFFPGRGRVLMAGDAMGLMHQGGEGISCALASGGYAGQAIAMGLETGKDPLPIYKKLILPEMVTALDQFNPLRMKGSMTSGSYKQPGPLSNFGKKEKALIMMQTVRLLKNEIKVPGLFPTILKNSLRRLIFKKYKINIVE